MLMKKIEDLLKEHFKTGPIQITSDTETCMTFIHTDGVLKLHVGSPAKCFDLYMNEGWSPPTAILKDTTVFLEHKREEGEDHDTD